MTVKNAENSFWKECMCMKELFTEQMIGLLVSGVIRRLEQVKDNYKWKRLFIKEGKFLLDGTDELESFEKELYAVFSKKNMKNLSNMLKDKHGYEFPRLLHDELYDLMTRYGVPEMESEKYIHNFSQEIIEYLEDNDADKTLEMYLGNWKKEETEYFNIAIEKLNQILKIVKGLEKIEVESLSISDVDSQIRKESRFKGMGLDFFDLDDEQFESRLQASIKNESVYVVGKSREETTYRILNELREKNSDRVTLLIKSEAEWKRLDEANLFGAILIPFFLAESIVAIPNNTNIFIYGEDEPCYNRDKLVLRRRTKRNIINSFEKIGIDSTVAYNMVENTHGLYAPLKKKLFNGAIYAKPDWVKEHSSIVMAALLCGKWTEADGDKLIFEELSGKTFDECKRELENYIIGENPFLVVNESHVGSNMQLASVEDAWEELDMYVTDEMWSKFIKLFYEVLIESEPIFGYPFEKHFEASIYADKPEWSPALKRGMIRTLIMRALYRSHAEYQVQIDNVVTKILDTITTKERWGYISQYITDLCEASPSSVLTKLEKEFEVTTGLIELFSLDDGDFLTSRHYYTHVLWAVEQLLLQKKYVARAVEWLWKMNSFEIEYKISNSPKTILGVVFCAWLNISVLSVDNKINMARRAVDEYPRAWEIILSELPETGSAICSTLNSPKYRLVDEPDTLYVDQANKTYIEYLRMCVKAADACADRWEKIIDHLHHYDSKIQNEIIEELISACERMDDCGKVQIKNKIRHLVYKHRYFKDTDWSMEDEQLVEYERLLNDITFEKPEYDYLYLFSNEYEFPLLNPIQYCREENSRTKNGMLRQEEIKQRMEDFKEKNYSLETLIDLAVNNKNNILGDVLAEFYCNEIFDETVFIMLLKKDPEGRHAYNYVRTLAWKKAINLERILCITKEFTKNLQLIANLISLQIIVDNKEAIIADESDEVKREFWSNNWRVPISENATEEVCMWALNECYEYGTLDSYIALLFDLKEKFQDNQIYQHLIRIKSKGGEIRSSMTDYYLKELLKTVQDRFMDNIEMCQEIGTIEWLLRDVMDWEQMKCMQHMMKADPQIYADLVKIIYKTDKNEEVNQEKAALADKLYSGFDKAKFCPAEKDGKVEYPEIKKWIDVFKESLTAQNQERLFGHLIGRLLAYSPTGADGYMPCEAVRRIIEEYYSDSLIRSYIIAEENKRGVYIADGGKSEIELSERYKHNAEALQYQYPHTAEIYFAISDSYKKEAEWERRQAEDEW